MVIRFDAAEAPPLANQVGLQPANARLRAHSFSYLLIIDGIEKPTAN
jgi:hypothetical protein